MMDKLRPLHTKLGRPKPGEWLFVHHEPGQTFQQYIASLPVAPDKERRIITIQPLGGFTKSQRRVVDLAAGFMGAYFNLPVKVSEDLPDSIVPARARRVHPSWGDR